MTMWGRALSIAVVLVIIGAVSWVLWPKPLAVETAIIAKGDLTITVEEEGTARISEVFRVTAPVTGKLVRVALHPGDTVQLGQSIASLEPVAPVLLDERSLRIAQAALEAAEAAVLLAETALTQAEAQRDYAQSEAERKQALSERGLVSRQVEEQALLAAENGQKNVDLARATLTIRQQDLAGARATLMDEDGTENPDSCCADVLSPIKGQVLTVLTESEQVVQAGTPLLEIGDPTKLEVAVDVLSSDAVRISPLAQASIEGWGGEPLAAQVVRVSPTAFTKVSALGIEEQRTEVVLRLMDAHSKWARLGHGFRVVARIVVWEGKDRVLAPIGALFRRGEAWSVFVVENGRANLRGITVGARNSSFAEVSAGLEAGDIVINHPGDNVSNGTAVTTID
jgi:HlyD family secretion protein